MATTETHEEVSAPADTDEVGPEETKEQIAERAMRQSESEHPSLRYEVHILRHLLVYQWPRLTFGRALRSQPMERERDEEKPIH